MTRALLRETKFFGNSFRSFKTKTGVVRVKHVSTYNSMIGGLALHRKNIEAVELFSEMLKERVRPNGITFVGVLNGCSHGWLVDMGGEIF
ncbi:hypothetical protein JHK87_000896 [Glycine soja]|nr:hypothetical protein JHK87_000896 [Glycine soja]